MDIRLQTITVFPVKSLQGISLNRARITGRGLAGDRSWVLTDENGKFLSQRSEPALARLKVREIESGLMISGPGQPELLLAPSSSEDRWEVQIWDDRVPAWPGSREAEQWFSRFLERPVKLAYMGPDCRRPVTSSKAPAGHEVGFADAYPLLAASQASLDDLNARLKQPVPMDRFRANLVFSGCEPHAEDSWTTFRLGEALLQAVKPCPRCAVPAVDQKTGQIPEPGEPLRTLATYRSQPDGVMFGMNLVVLQAGNVEVGNQVIRI